MDLREAFPRNQIERLAEAVIGPALISKSDQMVIGELLDGKSFNQFSNIVIEPGGLVRDVFITHDKDDERRLMIESVARMDNSKNGSLVRCKYFLTTTAEGRFELSNGTYQTEAANVVQQSLDLKTTREYSTQKLGLILHACLDHKLHKPANAA